MPILTRDTTHRFLVAIAAVALATIARLALDPWLGDRVPFATYFAAVVFAAWSGGMGPSALAVALSWPAASLFVLPPRGSLAVVGAEAQFGLALFLLVGVALVLMGGSLHAARRRAERALEAERAQAERLRVTLASIGDAVITTDAGGRVTSMNRGAEALIGWTAAEAAGRPLEEVFRLVHEETGEPVETPVARVLREGVVVGLANHSAVVARDGARRPIDDSAAPIRDEGGTIEGVVLVFRDVTERRRAERELQASERLHRCIAELTSDYAASGRMEGDGRVVLDLVTEGFVKVTGYTVEEMEARGGWASLVHPDDIPAVRASLGRMAAGEAATSEARITTRAGDVRWLRYLGRPAPDPITGRMDRITVAAQDVTEAKAAEARIAEQVRLAEYGRDIGRALAGGGTLDEVLARCAGATVRHLDGAFARIWTLDEVGEVLELRASAGMYTHTNGPHARIPVGRDKIGLIARQRTPHLTNAVIGDPRIPAQDWARAEGMVAFAGYPLVVEDRLVGVLAMFARHELSAEALRMMASVADEVAVGIERQRAEERLHRHREWLRVTLASIGDAVIATDTDGRVTFLNGVAEALTGWPQREAAGRPLGEVFHIVNEQTRREVENPAVRALREGAVVGLANHTILIARDGRERAIDDSAAPIRDESGGVMGAVLIFRDVAERRRAERALAASEARKAAILENALDAIVTMDHEGRVVEWNPAAERIFGFERAAVLGGEMGELIVPPALREAHRQGLARYLATGEGPVLGRRVEITAVRADGAEFPIELAITRIPAEGPPLFTAHIRDITGPKAIERRRTARLAVTEVLAGSATPAEAAPAILRAVCEALGWDLGALWLLDEGAGVLRCLDAWGRPSAAVAPFVAATRSRTYDPGVGLPGRVWSTGRAAWIPDVTAESNFPRGPLAIEAGLHGAFAAPITAGGAFLGVVEFYSGEVREPDPDLLELMATLGGQVGQFLERRRAEERLRRSEAELADFFENATIGLHWVGPDGTILRANRAELDLLGYDRAEYVGRHVAEFHCNEGTICDILRRLTAGEALHDYPARLRCKDGSIKDVLIDSSVMREGGRFVHTRCFTRDVTERLRAEEAIRERERRFHSLAESIPQLAWMARPDGHTYWYNRRWYEYTGTTPEQVEGWGWQAVHDPEVLPRVRERWEASIASGEPFDMVFPLRGADGRYRPFLTRVMPVRGADGRVAQWFGTNTDISDRLRIEEELREARDEADAANQAKTQFLAVLSHELRTPLNPILLSTSAMLERPADPEDLRPTLAMIRQNVLLQARLIDDLLDVMRIVRGKMPLHWEVADCHALIDQAVQICRSEVHSHRLHLEVDLAAGRRHVNADPARLQQVFWNLIKNAIKFTPEGGRVTVRTRNEGGPDGNGDGDEDRIVVEVRDTGIGIEPEILPKIFDPFQQGETTITRKFGGLGLGLAICKGIVDAHDGTLEAQSTGKGRGTTFRVVLKALPEPEVEGDGRPDRATTPGADAPPSSLRILAVEDEPATLRLMARLLRGLGHEVTTAGSVGEAAAAYEAGGFDLIISDIGLPDGTGLDVMRGAVARRGPVPAIALTGYGMEEDIRRSRDAGFTAHLTKPIDFAKLEAMIRQVAPKGS